jgi:hypothetical protein
LGALRGVGGKRGLAEFFLRRLGEGAHALIPNAFERAMNAIHSRS